MYFCGEIPDAQYKINLVFHNGHYNVITSLTSAFACTYFCEAWHVPYSNKDGHTCSYTCYACKTVSPPCKLEQGCLLCPACNRHLKNENCFAKHQGYVCKAIKKCTDCRKLVVLNERKSRHVCGEVYCTW